MSRSIIRDLRSHLIIDDANKNSHGHGIKELQFLFIDSFSNGKLT